MNFGFWHFMILKKKSKAFGLQGRRKHSSNDWFNNDYKMNIVTDSFKNVFKF